MQPPLPTNKSSPASSLGITILPSIAWSWSKLMLPFYYWRTVDYTFLHTSLVEPEGACALGRANLYLLSRLCSISEWRNGREWFTNKAVKAATGAWVLTFLFLLCEALHIPHVASASRCFSALMWESAPIPSCCECWLLTAYNYPFLQRLALTTQASPSPGDAWEERSAGARLY